MIQFLSLTEMQERLNTATEQHAAQPDAYLEMLAGHLEPTTRGHVETIYGSMVSEDGTGFVQALGVVELYRTKKGACMKVHHLWSAPECRSVGYGKCLLEHLQAEAGKRAGEGGVVAVVANAKNDPVVKGLALSMGYTVEEGPRGLNIWA